MEAIAQQITAHAADIYGLSSLCSSYPVTIRIARAIKAMQPGAMVLLGGPQASVVDRPTLEAFPFIDLVLRGEAELTLPLLLDELAEERRLTAVPGLTYRWKGELHRNGPAPIIEDLDSIPTPAYHLVGGLQTSRLISIELGRGCPYACTFCSTNDFFRRRFRLRSPARVIQDMRQLSAAYGVQEFDLVHDMFTIDRRRVVDFCEAMLASGTGFHWSCSARTDSVDAELLELMASAGCSGIFYGVEAGSPRMQKVIDKRLDLEQAREVIAATERLGIGSTVSLITGFPEEIWEDLRQTIRIFTFSARHPHSRPELNILAPLAETPIHRKYRSQLTLGELCSEMSQQSTSQEPENLRLIEDHPDIFPNFYLLPTPCLDRAHILELREFMLNVTGHFRWLMSAIDQAGNDFLDFFGEWREHRLQKRPGLKGADLRRYYKTVGFREDFLAFVRSSPVAQDKRVVVFLEFEDEWQRSSTMRITTPAGCRAVPCGHPAIGTDIPARSSDANLVELSCDIQKVIESLKSRTDAAWQRGPHFYLALETSGSVKRFRRVQPELGLLLHLSDGKVSVQELIERLRPELSDVEEGIREDVLTGLIESARDQGLLEIYRPAGRQAKTKTGVAHGVAEERIPGC